MGKRSKGETITGPGGTIRAGTQLHPQVAAIVTVGIIFEYGDDGDTFSHLNAITMLQADGHPELIASLENAQKAGQLEPVMGMLEKAITKALGGVIERAPLTVMPRAGRVGRA